MHASTVGFDVGFVLQSGYLGGLVLAASIQNFGGKMQMTGINSVVFVDIDETTSGNNPDIPARIEMDAWDLPLSLQVWHGHACGTGRHDGVDGSCRYPAKQ